MTVDVLRDIVSSAIGLQDALATMGIQKPRSSSAPITVMPQISIVSPRPLREALIKGGICKETATKLNAVYMRNINDYRSKAYEELRQLWRSAHEDGAHGLLSRWDTITSTVQRRVRSTLDDMHDSIVDMACEHVKGLLAAKRKSQPVFDQVCLFLTAYNGILLTFTPENRQLPTLVLCSTREANP